MHTLLDLLQQYQQSARHEAILWTEGLRTRRFTYGEVHTRIASFAAFLDSKQIRKGDRIVLWGENQPEWIFAFWGAIARGVQVVPVDYRFSRELCLRICEEAKPALLVHGGSVAAEHMPLPRLKFAEMEHLPEHASAGLTNAAIEPDDIVEIVFTSGTTGNPKGVVHRHRNIVANLRPFKEEIDRYRKWARPFQPLRLLNLLPLSHMFGQALGLFIPALLGGSIALVSEMHPAAIINTTRRFHISVIVCVPRMAQNLANEIERRFTLPPEPSWRGIPGVAQRWWRYRRVHALFGWKFWSVVVGGAHLEPELEAFWRRLGFLVIQGYGLTETSPVVAVNHPFHARRGSVGKAIKGQEVKIADDGEILVRGESVVGEVDEEGWFHTGDIGELDAEGNIHFKGRKKDIIVTPEGMNVHPEDVESVLKRLPGIVDAAVVGINDRIHASLLLSKANVDAAAIVAEANSLLEPHQRIRDWSVWPENDFPRTASTMKVRRSEVAERIRNGLEPGSRTEGTEEYPADLSALSSLERVDLLAELEQRYGMPLDEAKFAQIKTREQLAAWLAEPQPESDSKEERLFIWAASRPVGWLRSVLRRTVVIPLFRHHLPLTVEGVENLQGLTPPVLFVANHTSNLDTPAIVVALPAPWRWRLAPAVRQEQFRPFFEPKGSGRLEVLSSGVQYVLAGIFFNAYPLPQQMSGVQRALKTTAELVSRGFCPLVFPEGERTPDGRMHDFKAGAALMAVRLQIPVVPIFLSGLYEVYSVHDSWPKRGPVRVSFGPPLRFAPDTDYMEAARRLQEAVQRLAP